jgi:hypothetical protein
MSRGAREDNRGELLAIVGLAGAGVGGNNRGGNYHTNESKGN